MNFNETTMTVQPDVNDFHENVVNPFLEKSRIEYPYSIVQSNSNIVDITLLKSFPNNKYDFMYEDAIKSIEKFLKKIIPRYGLSEIKFHENAHLGFNPSFRINVPADVSSKELNQYWDDIFRKVSDFADSEKIGFILDDLSIVLCR
ncbi:hypothetical protein [Methanobrevibacter sp.]